MFTSTYQQTGFSSNLELITNGNMITGSSKNTLNDHEAVNMTMPVSKDMFPSVSTYQRSGNPEIIPMAVLLGAAVLYWLIFLRTLPPQRQRCTVPPEGTVPAYALFMGGDHAFARVDTDVDNGKCALVIKDSYANALIPFLTAHYETVLVIDPRSFYGTLSDLTAEYEIDEPTLFDFFTEVLP